MRRIIGVVSGKGGVGKTVTSLNLGLALHHLGQNSLVVDADLNNPNVGLQLGLYEFPTTINDALERKMSILEALHIHHSGLRLIPASISLLHLHTNPEKIKDILKDLDGYIILDCAPGFGKDVLSSLDVCDEVIVVTNPLFPAVVGAMRVIEVAKEMGKNVRGIVLNKVGKFEINHKEIEAITGVKVIGQIPNDKNVDLSIIAKSPIVSHRPYSPAAQAFNKVACAITGKDYKRPKLLTLKRTFDNLGLIGPKIEKDILSKDLD